MSGNPDTSTPQPPPGPGPSPEAVAAFLAAHPAFLRENPALYRVLEPPERLHGQDLADHMAAMIRAGRERTSAVQQQLDEVLATGREGSGLAMRLRRGVLALIRSRDVLETISQELPPLLGVECCTLVSEAPENPAIRRLPEGTVARLLPTGRDAVVREEPTETELLHREMAPLITRDALLRVPLPGAPTLLALGARDATSLPARHAAESLAFFGRALAAALTR